VQRIGLKSGLSLTPVLDYKNLIDEWIAMITMTPDEWITLEAFCLSCTIPIIYETNDRTGILGTGLLFQLNEHYVIITASHVADEIPNCPNLVGVPIGMDMFNEIRTLTDCEIVSPRKSDDKDKFDVALIVLDGSGILDRLKNSHTFLTLENIASNCEIYSEFLVAGFPESKSITRTKPGTTDGKVILGSFFKCQTQKYLGVVEGCLKSDDKHYLFVSYDTKLISNTGIEVTAPKLQGISGCPIWTFVEPNSEHGVWTPRNIIKVAAIEMSYLQGCWIRGIRWHAVAHNFGYIDPDAKELLNNKVFAEKSNH